MPPVTKAGGQQFRKDVEFVAKDDDEQVAAGIVMVPDKADLQNDFAREDTIRGFADQFEAFVDAGEAGGGIMHAVFPDDWMALERNEVLDEAEDIGGQTVDAGAWVQEWQIDNADLWGLIDDGILDGYSIGAIQVDWNGPFDQDEVDDVAIPDDLGENALVWELIDGIIREVSAVDIPAVPDAQILETKADAEKRLGDYLGDRDGFVEEALQRGHSEDEAERLWDILNAAVEVEGSGEPGKESMFSRAGKAFLSALSATDSESDDGVDEASKSPEASDAATAKEGRTLSKTNRDSLYATIDASLDILQDAGVDHGMTRFTDREDADFDLAEHSGRTWTDDEDDDEDEDEENGKDAPGGDTPDDDSTDMSKSDDPMEDAPEWAKALQDEIEENSKQIDEALTEDGDDPEKSAGDDDVDPMEDAPEWAKALKEEQEKNAERIDTISQQSGYSDQLEAAAGGESNEDDDGLDTIGKVLS